MSDLQEHISASFSAQGLMATLGAELVRVVQGEVQIALLPRPELSQQHGYIHAGALTSVLDSACGYAALTVAPPGLDVLTVEFKPAAGSLGWSAGWAAVNGSPEPISLSPTSSSPPSCGKSARPISWIPIRS